MEKINLKDYEKKIFSQYGEDGVLEKIFKLIGTTNKYFVEFGSDGFDESMGNTAYLRTYGFDGLLMEGHHHRTKHAKYKLMQEFITADNVENVFKKYDVPIEFDLLSIDIDGNDFYVWKAIEKYIPRVVVIEYNCGIEDEYSIPYNPNHIWAGNYYFGASFMSMYFLAKEKNYSLVYSNDVNLIFVKSKFANNFMYVNDIKYHFTRKYTHQGNFIKTIYK